MQIQYLEYAIQNLFFVVVILNRFKTFLSKLKKFVSKVLKKSREFFQVSKKIHGHLNFRTQAFNMGRY